VGETDSPSLQTPAHSRLKKVIQSEICQRYSSSRTSLPWYITCICLLHLHMSIPPPYVYSTSICLLHLHMSTPPPYVYSTSICLFHLRMSIPPPYVYSTSICLLHLHMSTPPTYVYSTSFLVIHTPSASKIHTPLRMYAPSHFPYVNGFEAITTEFSHVLGNVHLQKQIASLLMLFIKNFHVSTLLCKIRSGSQIRA